jgi:hypothetical protein
MKTQINTNLIGKVVADDPKFNDGRGSARNLKYFGLEDPTAEIVAAWLQEGNLKLMVRDSAGHAAEIFPTCFLILDAPKKGTDGSSTGH